MIGVIFEVWPAAGRREQAPADSRAAPDAAGRL
jgi:hypothetical protein